MDENIVCGCNGGSCGGSSEFGTKCYGCPNYDTELDGRLDQE